MRNLITILAVVALLSIVGTAAANTVASSTMYFQGPLTDNLDGTYTGVVAMIDEGGSDSGYDIYGKEGDTAWFGDAPGPVWTSQAIGAAHDAWPTWTPDTPDWYQYSLNLYVDGGVQKWAVRNHAGATAANPWYDTIPGWPKIARGVPMSGLMEWVTLYAIETDTGAYLPGTGVAEIPGGAATKGGGPSAWDMDWSWGSEVVPLELPGFDVEITGLGGGVYKVKLTPSVPSTVWVDATYNSSTPGWGITCFNNIQDAVDAVESGGTIEILSDLSEGLITIDKDLTILGGSVHTVSANQDTGNSGDSRAWFLVNSGVELHVKDIIFDGNGYLIYQAFRHKGSGSFTNCEFIDIKYNESGPDYAGLAVVAFGDGPVDVCDCTFSEIGRVGALYFGTGVSDSLFQGCTYTGKGTGDWLDYALDISAGAEVNVVDCDISACQGVASGDGSTSAGVMVTTYYGAGTAATVLRNTITANTTGIAAGYDSSDTCAVFARYNDLGGNDSEAVDNTSTTEVVDAEYNWWGASDGPGTVGPGSGDEVSVNVDYDPWMPVLADLVVDPAGNGDYTTIQDAVDNANPGDTIFVVSGSHAGAIVDKDVTIYGSSNPAVITSGVPYKAGSSLTTAFRLEDTSDGAEIRNFIIECNEPDGFYFAVFARLADDVIVDSLTVNESVQGITNWNGNNWKITNNVISNSLPASGGGISIWLGVIPSSPETYTCSGNLIEGNRIITSYEGAVGFTCPAVGMGIDCRYIVYPDDLTFSEEMTGNQILNNIMKDEGHSNQVGVEIGVLGLGGDTAKITAVIGMIHDNTIKDNTIQDTDAGVYFYNVSTLTIEDNTIRNCADSGIYIEGDQNDCSINNNSIYGNANYGVDNNTPSMVDAENNWWGAAGGPDATGNPNGDPSSGDGGGDAIRDYVDANPWLGADPWVNILKLDAHSAPVYLNPDGAVGPNQLTIDMDALSLAQHVFGCQAILNFESAYFLAGAGEVDVQPGGGIWDELIYDVWTVTGDLDVAVGVDLSSAVGTKADGTVAKFTLTVNPGASDGTTNMEFRMDVDDEESTYFGDFLGQRVNPGSKINSQDIIIDGTDPVVQVTYPNGGENIKGGSTCTITWNTTETNKDYVDLEYTDDDGTSWNSIATGENDDGSYDWTPVPLVDTSLAKVRVTATDLAGNSGSDESDGTFIIDSTDPTVVDIKASQSGGPDLTPTGNGNAVQSPPVVDIAVQTSDNLSGVAGAPTVTVKDSANVDMPVTPGAESPVGTYNYTVSVQSTTANGAATITVSGLTDNAGNVAGDVTDTFDINKNQVTGTVSMATLSSASYLFNRNVVFTATDGGGVLKTWTETVSFTNNTGTKIASGPYILAEVPGGTVNLSAKTAWSLRERQSVSFNSDMQATNNFTLLGGDINDSNGNNILDFSVLKINWMTTNAVADINGDGVVQLLDYSILKSNWFKKGDPQ